MYYGHGTIYGSGDCGDAVNSGRYLASHDEERIESIES